MTAPKTQDMLKNASVIATVGTRPHSVRNSFKMVVGAIVLATASTLAFASDAQAQSYNQYQQPQHQQVVEVSAIPATVVSVRRLSQNNANTMDRYERHNQQSVDRTTRLVGSAVGAVLGGVLADKASDNRSSRTRGYARTLGTIGGGVVGNSLAQMAQRRRDNQNIQQSGNVRHVQNAYDVTVNLQLPGNQVEQVVITQSNGEFRRGDFVNVVTNRDGTANVVSTGYAPSNRYSR